MTDHATLPITARFGGRTASRAEVLAFERARGRKVARRLGIPAGGGDLLARVVDHKLELGHAGVRRLLRRDTAISAPVTGFAAAVSRGRRTLATTTLTCDAAASAELLPEWYLARFRGGEERSMLAASPDHWVFGVDDAGRDEVLETPAGSPAAVQMFFDLTDVATVRTPADPAFPGDWAGVARSGRGAPFGGIRHRFRDEPGGGFTAELNVEFPVTMLPWMITQHCWHLACEFSNWIEFANGTREP